MQCREAVFAEDVLVYVLDNYRGEEYIREVYNPDCYIRLDDRQAIIYQQVQNVNGEAIQKYGFSAIPNVFGLMSEEALEASGVLRIRRQPSLDLYGQGVLIGIVDTGIDFTHKAFVAADGTSRIVSIWDQSVEEGVGNENFPYGRMYSREQLNQALSSKIRLKLCQVRMRLVTEHLWQGWRQETRTGPKNFPGWHHYLNWLLLSAVRRMKVIEIIIESRRMCRLIWKVM